MIFPYGDTDKDGAIQISFCLPVEPSPKTKVAAAELAKKMGLTDVKIAHMDRVGVGHSFIVAFGKFTEGIDMDQIHVPILEVSQRDYKEIDALILENIGRPIRVVGGNNGFDAHTVGLDAILNMKGFNGDIGLERYKGFRVWNMGSQVPTKQLVQKAIDEKADAILLSKIVTQNDIHLRDMNELLEILRDRDLEDQFIIVVGGPRITHAMALEYGFDAGFSIGCRPSDVANYLYEEVLRRKK